MKVLKILGSALMTFLCAWAMTLWASDTVELLSKEN